MPVVVRDLVPAFLDFWKEAGRVPVARQVELWREYVAQNPDVVNDVTRRGDDPEPTEAFSRYPALLERITTNAPLANRWITEAADLVSPALQADHLNVPCVSLVGLARSNGWVSRVDGRHTLFIAIEQVPDEVCAQILSTHEMAHALQLPLSETPWPENGPLGHGIYTEGFATALTAELMPSFGLAEHLWFGPGYDDWLAECERLLSAARAEIVQFLDSADRQIKRRYLLLSSDYHLPQRIGYLVGARAVQELRLTYSWPELARWSPDRAMEEMRRVL
jgi:hypothetical protein